jgi:hypothetical protein
MLPLLGADEIDRQQENQPGKIRPVAKVPLSEQELDELRVRRECRTCLRTLGMRRPVGRLSSMSWRGLTSGQAVESDLPVTVARPCRIFTCFRGHEGNIVWTLTEPCQPSTETERPLDFKLGRFHPKKCSCVIKMRQSLTLAIAIPARTPFAPRTANERGIHDLRRRYCQRRPMPENKLLKSLP